MEEVLWHAERAGVSGLEVDRVDGRDVSQLSGEDLGTLIGRLAQRKKQLKVALVRTNVLTEDSFRATLRAGQALKAKAIIMPLTGSLETLKARAAAARRAGLRFLLENVAISSEATAKIMRTLGTKVCLAFNPAHLAAVGELPFLGCMRPLKRFTRYLAITDASPLGVPCLPGNGYGQITELISVLRCSSFNGFFSLGAAPAAELDFDEIADAFYRLLDAC